MEYLSTTYGLVTDRDPTSENGQLFLVEYMLLKDSPWIWVQRFKKGDSYYDSVDLMDEQLILSRVERGLYNRNPLLLDRTNSHDNISAIMTRSFLCKDSTRKNNVRFDIWNYLLKHLGTYDNTKGKSKQLSRFLPFGPSNFFIWGLCADSKIYLAFLPFYLLSLVMTCYKPINDTSGKILAWVEMYPHKEHWLVKHLFKYYERKMKGMYGDNYIKELMKIYHAGNSSEFPINKILGVV